MKKWTAGILGICLSIMIPFSTVYGQEEEFVYNDDIVIQKMQVDDIIISELSDGRIQAIPDASQLSEEQKNKYLMYMGFTADEISSITDSDKIEIIQEGGKKVETIKSDEQHSYIDPDGKEYIITEQNQNEINKIRARDIAEQRGGSASIIENKSTVSDGIFSGWSSVVYIGKTANAKEFKYSLRTHFNWSQLPYFYLTDSIGHSWGGSIVGVHSNGSYDIDDDHAVINRSVQNLDQSSTYGTKAEIDLFGIAGRHYGSLRTEVRIPVSNKGLTGAFGSVYGHAHTPANMSISIKSIGIDISGIGDKWTWRESFMIGG